MAVVGSRDGKPFLDCVDRHHTTSPAAVWDEAHLAQLIADVEVFMHDNHLGNH